MALLEGRGGLYSELVQWSGYKKGVWSQSVCLGVCLKDTCLGPSALNVVMLLLKTNGLAEGLLRCFWIS